MADMDRLLAQLPPRAVELFAVMSRIEFALKENGWGKASRDGAVEVSWDRYANKQLGPKFLAALQDKAVCPTLLSRPPSLQILAGESLDWEERPAPTSVQDLIGAVRRVRNNLFHGGKSGSPDRDRDEKLVGEALAVLESVLGWDYDLQLRFQGDY